MSASVSESVGGWYVKNYMIRNYVFITIYNFSCSFTDCTSRDNYMIIIIITGITS